MSTKRSLERKLTRSSLLHSSVWSMLDRIKDLRIGRIRAMANKYSPTAKATEQASRALGRRDEVFVGDCIILLEKLTSFLSEGLEGLPENNCTKPVRPTVQWLRWWRSGSPIMRIIQVSKIDQENFRGNIYLLALAQVVE
ncbi:hypothetical protein BY996DRAFT_6465771 [Phakopsora pachyrhizi]|nr:hypothetical protein BY996DRAFT_6465771 [Phakopsora pachyrhizi]